MSNAPLLPPRQQAVAEGCWPVIGERAPRRSGAPWEIRVDGLVERPRSWSLEDLRARPQAERTVDLHCIIRWSKLGARFRGVPLSSLLEECGPLAEAKHVFFSARSERSHTTSFSLEEAIRLDVLLAFEHERRPLEEAHGGPIRLIVPRRYFYKSLKWVAGIELLAEERLGFLEAGIGHHQGADPWKEERYRPPRLDPREVAERLAARDIAGRDFSGIDARRLAIAGLDARGAILRNACFEDSDLARACFDGANLTNARFAGANLREASFRPLAGQAADSEGADFRGADLRGAVFEGVSLLGAAFCRINGEHVERGPALIDATTRIDSVSLESLSPLHAQAGFLEQVLGRRG